MENKKNLPYDESHEIKPLTLVTVIVNQGSGRPIASLLEKYESSLIFVTHGLGTSPNYVLSTIGSGGLKKTIIFGIILESRWIYLKEDLEKRFNISSVSKGVAFATKITAVSGISVYKMLSNTRLLEKAPKKRRIPSWKKKTA